MREINTDIVVGINQTMGLQISPGISIEEFRKQLAATINELISKNFEKLVFYLYRIDVDENKMRNLLDSNKDGDTAVLLADLIIERHMQKVESRKKFVSGENVSENEKW